MAEDIKKYIKQWSERNSETGEVTKYYMYDEDAHVAIVELQQISNDLLTYDTSVEDRLNTLTAENEALRSENEALTAEITDIKASIALIIENYRLVTEQIAELNVTDEGIIERIIALEEGIVNMGVKIEAYDEDGRYIEPRTIKYYSVEGEGPLRVYYEEIPTV